MTYLAFEKLVCGRAAYNRSISGPSININLQTGSLAFYGCILSLRLVLQTYRLIQVSDFK